MIDISKYIPFLNPDEQIGLINFKRTKNYLVYEEDGKKRWIFYLFQELYLLKEGEKIILPWKEDRVIMRGILKPGSRFVDTNALSIINSIEKSINTYKYNDYPIMYHKNKIKFKFKISKDIYLSYGEFFHLLISEPDKII